jgi:hypothetical protein
MSSSIFSVAFKSLAAWKLGQEKWRHATSVVAGWWEYRTGFKAHEAVKALAPAAPAVRKCVVGR